MLSRSRPGSTAAATDDHDHALAAARRDIVRRALAEDLAPPDVGDRSATGDATSSSPPGDATSSSPPGDATSSSPPGDATSSSPPGDATSLATVPPDATGVGRLLARVGGVVAGLETVAEVYDQLDARVEVRLRCRDGDPVEAGEVVAEVAGPLRSVLTGERTALNLVTHLSGVATITAAYVAAVAPTDCHVRDTRKTTPGLRLLEKAAVRAGGGTNHRVGLVDALLVKENHVAAAGGVGAATRGALAEADGRSVQVEVETLDELDEAVGAGARDVLLDNFDVEATRRAVARARELGAIHGPILLESSGGLDLRTVGAYARAGVDRVSIGALTHSAPQLDLALEITRPGEG